MKKTVLFLLTGFIIGMLGCTSKPLKASRPSHWGRVVEVTTVPPYAYLIQSENGGEFYPINLPEAYRANGLRVYFDYVPVKDGQSDFLKKIKITRIEME